MLVLFAVNIRCAVFWVGDLLLITFAHLILGMVFESMLFTLCISCLCASLVGSIESGMLNAIMSKVLGLRDVLSPM